MKKWNNAPQIRSRLNEDNKLYLLQCALRLPELFAITREELRPEHFDQLAEPHYAVLWRSVLMVASENDNILPANEELAKTLIELKATELVDSAPSNLTAGGMLDQLFVGLDGNSDTGLIADIYNSRTKDSLDFKTGIKLLKQFLDERATFDPYKRVMDQLGSGMIPTDLDSMLDKIKADRERINSLDVSPVEDLVPDTWEANAIEQVPSSVNFLDVAMDGGPAKGEVIVLLGPTGGGKLQPLYSLIQTPSGPVRMGEIKVGQIVCAADGTTTEVTGVYPQGNKDVYRVTFTDGDFVDAGLEHLWLVDSSARGWTDKVVDTQYLIDNIKSPSGRLQLSIKVPSPIEMKEQKLPLDPYLMGLLLGNGSFRHGVRFTNSDEELIEAVICLSSDLSSAVRRPHSKAAVTSDVFMRKHKSTLSNGVLEIIKQLGLFKKYYHEKEIPKVFLNNSVPNRLALLQGLMDTNGYAGIGHHVNYYTASKIMAEQVKWLVESLGGICKIKIKRISGYTSVYYDCVILLDDARQIFRLSRKKDRVRPRTRYKVKRIIKSVEFIGNVPTQCISVNHSSHLYLTDHCVVTHNTLLGIMVAVNGARYQMQLSKESKEAGYWYYFSYESPITPDIRCRVMSYAAELHFGETMKKFTNIDQLSRAGNLKPYEMKRWEKQLKVGLPVPGEYERYNAAVSSVGDRLKLIDMSGTKNPSVGSKGVEEIARVLQDGISQGRKPIGIVIDYAGIMVERYMSARNEKIDNEFYYLNRFVNNIRTQVAGRFNCISWVLHQLHGEAAAASPTAKQHHSKARGARNFADNANFAFNIGTKDPQTNCCIVTCTKARRADMVKNPPIVYIDGAFGRMEAQDQKYQLDQTTKKIVDRQVARMYQNNIQDINQMIARKPKNASPNVVTDL